MEWPWGNSLLTDQFFDNFTTFNALWLYPPHYSHNYLLDTSMESLLPIGPPSYFHAFSFRLAHCIQCRLYECEFGVMYLNKSNFWVATPLKNTIPSLPASTNCLWLLRAEWSLKAPPPLSLKRCWWALSHLGFINHSCWAHGYNSHVISGRQSFTVPFPSFSSYILYTLLLWYFLGLGVGYIEVLFKTEH